MFFYFNLYFYSFTFKAPRGQVLCKRNADTNELACTLNCSSGESPAIPKPRFQSKGGHTFVNSTMSWTSLAKSVNSFNILLKMNFTKLSKTLSRPHSSFSWCSFTIFYFVATCVIYLHSWWLYWVIIVDYFGFSCSLFSSVSVLK